MLSASNLEYRPGDVEFQIVPGFPLQAEVDALAFALLREQRRADQAGHQHWAAAHGARVVRQDLDAVASDVPLLIDGGDHHAEGALGVLPVEQARELRIVFVGKIRVGHLPGEESLHRLQVERLARDDVDRAADAALFEVRLRRLEHFHLADDVRRQHQVVEAARRVQLVEDEPVGGRERVAVQQRARQRRGQAAQVHALAFAEVAADHDARHALQGFGEILVGELADVLGIQRVDHADRFALGLERFAQAAADAGNHDLFDLPRARRLLCVGCLPG